jgi:hypothetical protein
VQQGVYQGIASGRIDVLELLACQDMRFFVEVATDRGELERRLYQRLPNTLLGTSRVIWRSRLSTGRSSSRLQQALRTKQSAR